MPLKTSINDVEEVDSDENERILNCAAAIDVAKATGMVCVRRPHPSIEGRRTSRVWEVESTTNSILALGDDLVAFGVERVVLESTSDYWRPFFYLLEAAGLAVWLVNARDVKQVTGRPKTDKLDAVWLAKLTERGMLRPSFVPPREIRALRDYTRLRSELVEERSRHKQRLEKLLEDALIKLSSVATDLLGVSARAMIEALIAGERDPLVLADLARGKLHAKRAALIEALTGRFDDHHGDLARLLLDQIDACTDKVDRLTTRIEQLVAELPKPSPPTDREPRPTASDVPVEHDPHPHRLTTVQRLDEVPGIAERAAQIIIAEVGLDMAQFPTPAHLVSWAKLSPQTIQSGPRTKVGKTGKGNRYLKGVLGEVATAAAKTDTFLSARYRRLVRRRGKQRALVAVARSILVIVWHLLNDPDARYVDLKCRIIALTCMFTAVWCCRIRAPDGLCQPMR
ncbi:MAG: IS110 family transposase [Actinomycetota bacterium]|nr:IS110 family transposase [Actinomycetota bacterium]